VTQLVLSLFPGIGLLDMAFEQEGFCVVRGPDLLWGGDIKAFHPPAGKFDGVIGGPPCQRFSSLQAINTAQGRPLPPDLIPEFARVVAEAQPDWWLMENVPQAPSALVDGYKRQMVMLDNNWVGGEQRRLRKFTFGTRDGRKLTIEEHALYCPNPAPTVTRRQVKWDNRTEKSRKGRPMSTMSWANLRSAIRLQGLPETFLDNTPFTLEGACGAIGNGVPLPMGRAVAQAVKRALDIGHK